MARTFTKHGDPRPPQWLAPGWNAPEETPAWLPEGVDHFIGFKIAHYWMSGTEVAATDMVGSDEDLFYIPGVAAISPGVGFANPDTSDSSGLIIGAAGDAIIAGATVEITYTLGASVSGNPTIYIELIDSGDFNTDLFLRCRRTAVGTITDNNGHTVALPALSTGSHKTALNITPMRLAGSQDGTDPAVGVNPSFSIAPTIVAFAAQWGAVIESIAIRATPVAEADLPALANPV